MYGTGDNTKTKNKCTSVDTTSGTTCAHSHQRVSMETCMYAWAQAISDAMAIGMHQTPVKTTQHDFQACVAGLYHSNDSSYTCPEAASSLTKFMIWHARIDSAILGHPQPSPDSEEHTVTSQRAYAERTFSERQQHTITHAAHGEDYRHQRRRESVRAHQPQNQNTSCA